MYLFVGDFVVYVIGVVKEVGVGGNGYDVGNDWDVDVLSFDFVDLVNKVVGIVEYLSYDKCGIGVDFFF